MKRTRNRRLSGNAMLVLLALSVAWRAGVALQAASPNPASGQAALQEPQYANSFYYLGADGSLKPLEREPVGVGGRVKAFGFGGTSVSYQIQNEHSPVRFQVGAPIRIIVKMENLDVDPATLVVLYSLKVDRGKRQLLISGMGFMGSHTKSDLQSKQLQLMFTKYGQTSVKIEPANPLEPGEYAMTIQSRDQQPVAYCFGVDAAQ